MWKLCLGINGFAVVGPIHNVKVRYEEVLEHAVALVMTASNSTEGTGVELRRILTFTIRRLLLLMHGRSLRTDWKWWVSRQE
jgi:hypothetical protein